MKKAQTITAPLELALNLSSQQCQVLYWLLSVVERAERQNQTIRFGALWKDFPIRRDGEAGNTARVKSRTLARLEERGLVLRMNHRTGKARSSTNQIMKEKVPPLLKS